MTHASVFEAKNRQAQSPSGFDTPPVDGKKINPIISITVAALQIDSFIRESENPANTNPANHAKLSERLTSLFRLISLRKIDNFLCVTAHSIAVMTNRMESIVRAICIASDPGHEALTITRTHPSAKDILLTIAGDDR